MLTIKNLKAVAEDQEVLNNINLEVKKNQVHAIFGPEKSGKSALMYVLAGLPYVQVTEGSIVYKSKKITNQPMHERSLNGIVPVFQELIEVPNNTNWELIEAVLRYRQDKRDHAELKEIYRINCEALGLDPNHGDKEANSDGLNYLEAIKNEFLMLTMLQPDLALIDFLDEKLEYEDREELCNYVADLVHTTNRSAIVFSKNKSVLEAINPSHVHLMIDGKIVLSGGKELLQRIEEDGYSELPTS